MTVGVFLTNSTIPAILTHNENTDKDQGIMKKRNELISALSPLRPISIIDTTTGEYVSLAVLEEKIGTVIETVFSETKRLYFEHKPVLTQKLADYTGTPQAAEFARQNGYSTSFITTLPKPVKAKSRLEKLVQFKLVSETDSYVKNTDPDKKEHSFNKTINLGAVDKQMANISLDGSELNLVWKCWDAEYYITFQLPAYVMKRNIVKFSLPIVKRSKKTGRFEFIFNLFELMKPRNGNKHKVGIDLGKVIPYSMAVVNKQGQRVASYETSPRLTRLARKRERLLSESWRINTKVENRAKRGLSSPVQEMELSRVTNKTTRLTKTVAQQTGSEIAKKLAKHNSNLIHVEDLSWVSGSKNSKIGSSRWSHSQHQEAITHTTSRIGFKTKKVSPKNTSQSCHGCKAKITHRKNRTVWCGECKSTLDRDFNAAMNIAKFVFPVSKKLNGGTTGNSGVTQVTSKEVFSENLPLFCHSLTRMAT